MIQRARLTAELWDVPYIFNKISQGTLALPDFQRRFEWGVTDVRSYLSTVLAGLPAGSLLIADNSSIQVELRPLEGAPGASEALEEVDVLLDGQQRLTALWQAANDVGPERYFVDFGALMDGADLLQDSVVISSSVHNLRRFLSRAQLESRKLVPVSALLSATHFFSWLRRAAPSSADAGTGKALGAVFAENIEPIEKYQIPVTRLSGQLDLSTVAQIFERTNKGGQRLDAFDLLVARLQGAGWSLRQAWEDCLRVYPQIERVFGENGLGTVSAISLLVQEDVRRSAVLSLAPSLVAQHWDDAVEATRAVADLLLHEGVRRPDLLPYDSIAIAMIASSMAGVPNSLLRQYFWIASAGLRYEVASNTKIVSDFRTISNNGISSFRGDWTLKPEIIEMNTRRSSKALWATVIAAILSRNPLDLATGGQLSSPEPVARDDWDLVSIAKGGGYIETERDVPARLRTASQILSLPGRSSSLRRLGLVTVVRQGLVEPHLFGPTIEDRLRSQFMPESGVILGGATPRELIERRAAQLYAELEARAMG